MLEKIKSRYLKKIEELLTKRGKIEVTSPLDWYSAEELLHECGLMEEYPALADVFYCSADERISDEDKVIILEEYYGKIF